MKNKIIFKKKKFMKKRSADIKNMIKKKSIVK